MDSIQKYRIAYAGFFLSLSLLGFSSPLHAQVYEKVFDFKQARTADIGDLVGPPGRTLVQGSDGNLYLATDGTSGAYGNGAVFSITLGGALTKFADFTNTGTILNTFVQGSDGNFYGTGREPASGSGTFFRMTPSGVATTLVTTLARSPGGLVQGKDGNFYGTTEFGGAGNGGFGYGTVFKVTPNGVQTTLLEFTGDDGPNKGGSPQGALLLGNDGNFYGTTQSGGASGGNGTVFRMTPAGVLTTLVEFTASGMTNRGAQPMAGLTQGNDDNFYGTTLFAGADGLGTVFKMTPDGVLTTLVEFTGNGTTNRGGLPSTRLVLGSDGNFYGTTERTTGLGDADDLGTVFKMTPAGELTTLVEFTGTGGAFKGTNPSGNLMLGSDGNFYGTTRSGGGSDSGTLFKMTADGKLTTIIEFKNASTSSIGITLGAALVQGANGNYYGTTSFGGTSAKGTLFELSQTGELTTLLAFTGNGTSNKGSAPSAALVIGRDKNFYGTTSKGGANDLGTIFTMTPAGVLTTLVEFTGNGTSNKGSLPIGGLVHGSDDNFYGTTAKGGVNNLGTVFQMTPAGALTTLVEFTGNGATNRGLYPIGPLVVGDDGDFYGTTQGDDGATGYGTVFRMTHAGVLTTLVDFTNNGTSNKGNLPSAALFKAPNGDLYGTTFYGGAYGIGTIFKMTPAGELTTLVEFSGNSPTNKGTWPGAALLLGSDGNFYGTTLKGGANDFGTAFMMTPAGVLTTLVEFEQSNGVPRDLAMDADGNLYGTTETSTIYRLIFPGAPTVVAAKASIQGNTSAILTAQVNARGTATAVSLEYGTDGINFPNIVSLAVGVSGYQTKVLGTTVNALNSGTTYFYRFHAVSSKGTTVSPIRSFTTLSAPVVVGLPATNISPTSAILNGTVNARNFDSTVIIEWGIDGNSFPNRVAANPPIVTGNTPVPVSFSRGNQQPGQTFFYRVVATNAGGTATSGTQSYRTLTPATATITGSSALSTTRAQVTGMVDPKGSSADVFFEYGTNGVDFPNSFTASPGLVSGDGPTEVTATLTGLTQGTTYSFRIRALGPGGPGMSDISTFSLSILSGLQQVFPDPPPASDRTVTVNFTPTTVGAWRFIGDTEWRNSGVAAGNLATGQRIIEFLPIPGFISPPAETVDVTSTGNVSLDRIYFQTPTMGSGSLTVRLRPDEIAAPEVPVADRVQWRIVGESAWRDSGVLLNGLLAGSYLVESKPVAGRETPPTIPVTIAATDSQDLTLTYFTANSAGGLPLLPKTFSDVSANEDLPFAYLGQIRSEVGASTGFVVKRRVVASAGHVVFDDGTLSAITNLQWLFQRHTGEHEPKPQIPRGYYLTTGYAEQRIQDNSPGEGSALSQNLDYAAIYFTEEAGRGGYGGFLASDSGDDNEFLNSTAQKILAGYPVDGVPAADKGKIHATAPFTSAMIPAFGETWTTTAVKGLGGTSGGPLFVRYNNGSYLPAAIYLGGAEQTVVRAIDSAVVDLFLRAEVSGNGGNNDTGGGITHSSFATVGSPTQPGSLEVTIQPKAARIAGAGWRLKPETSYRPSGNQKTGLNTGTYKLQLATVSGFEPPTEETVLVNGGRLTQITYTYQSANTAPTITRITDRSIPVNTNTGSISFTIGDAETSAGALTLTKSTSNQTLVPGSGIVLGGSGANRTISVTPAANQIGSADITVTVSDGSHPTSMTFVLKVTGPDIAIKYPAGTDLTDGGAAESFGSVVLTEFKTRTFTIRNRGTTKLTNLTISVDGKDFGDFTITQPLEGSLGIGGKTTFKVTFKPTAKTIRKATIHISSDDPDESPFDIFLTGKGIATQASSGNQSPPRLPSWAGLLAENARPCNTTFHTSVITLSDGRKYRAVSLHGATGEIHGIVEVSPNLLDWYSGNNHTTILIDTAFDVKVRDNTPFTSEKNRFIRFTRRSD